MIVFDLKCDTGHVFEAWFGSSGAYEDQRGRGLIACPICGSEAVEKAVMAPNIAAKGNQRVEAPAVPRPAEQPSPEMVKAAIETLAKVQARMLENSQWVGGNFATRARAMHDGDEPVAQIHGQATADETQELIEDGIQVAPLLLPVVPPEASN